MDNKTKTEAIHLTLECIPCAINSLIKLFKNGFIEPDKQEAAMRVLLKFLSEIDFRKSPPEVAGDMHRLIRKIIDDNDPYFQVKQEFNTLMLKFYPELKRQLEMAPDDYQLALRLAIAGNVIDFGPNHNFNIEETLKTAHGVKLAVDHSAELKAAVRNAERMLYIGDNAGEIVMDRILLETLNHPNVYFAVRGAPTLNDATLDDAKQTGIDKIATMLSTGDDSPGVVLDRVSEEFRRVFDTVDLIIAKGQGNYEGLCHYHKNIYFLLMAKCDHVAQHIGVRKGDFLLLRGK
ncbi:DUF89 family protein [candidate division KSB1 bacterium]|nr:DUF89 family protein [candidate division KSB1 bacterium]